MNRPTDPRDPSNRDSSTRGSSTRDPLDDLLSRALVSRASAARPGTGSLNDVHRRVRQRARRRTTVGAGAMAGLGLVGVGVVLTQDDDAPAPIQTADGDTDGMPEGGTGGGAWRCWDPVAPPDELTAPTEIDPATSAPMPSGTGPVPTDAPIDTAGSATTTPAATLPAQWFAQCEFVSDAGWVPPAVTLPGDPTTTITLPGDPTTSIGSVASEQPLIGIRVLVANGSGVSGLAGDMSRALEDLGASVASPQNAAYLAEETRVYLIGNTGRDLRSLLELTGVAEVEPIDAADAEGLIEGEIGAAQVVIVLGRDQVAAESPDTTEAPLCAHIVQTGDDLAGIAEKFGVSIDTILAANEWPDGVNHILIPGAEVLIPRTEC